MARNITVTFDDGTSHVYQNAPDNLTPDMVQARAQQDFGKTVKALDGGRPALPAAGGVPGPRTGPLVDQIPGYGKAVPAAPQAQPESGFIGKLLSPLETAVTLGVNAVTAPIVEGAKIYGTLTSGKYGTQAGIKAGEETGRKVQQFFQPVVSPESQAQTQAIGNALASTGLQGVPLNVLADLQRGMTPALRAGVDVVNAPIAARAEKIKQARIEQSYRNAPRIDAAKDAVELGIALDPAVSNPTAANKLKSSLVGSSNLDVKLAQQNLPKFTDAAKSDLGIPTTTKLDAKAFEQSRARPEISGPYDAVRNAGTLMPDESTLAKLDSMKVTPLVGDTGQAAAANTLLDTVKEQIAGGVDGKLLVDSIRQRRRDATAIYNQQSKGVNPPSPEQLARAEINMAVADALEGMIENNISNNPKLLSDFRRARVEMAKSYDYERATNHATGQIDPQVIAKMAEEGKPMSGTLAKIGNVAANFPEVSKGGVANAPTWREKLTRSGAAGTVGAVLGSPFGLTGSIVGGAAGAAVGNVAAGAAARRMATPGYQAARAVPADYRPIPSGLRPVEPNVTRNALVPYDYSQATSTAPNFVMMGEQYAPEVTPGVANLRNALPAPSAEGTLNALRAEDVRRANVSRAVGQQAEAQAAAAEAAARRPARGEVILDINPLTGAPEISKGLKGATPESFQNFGSSLASAADKATAGKAFDMTAAEKVAWDKTKVDLAEVVPGMKSLNDKAIAAKMQDRAWVQDAIAKAQEKARAFEDIAARAANERLRQDARMKREQMMGLLDSLEEQFSKARPVKTGGQGPKTRAHQRNMLRPDGEEIQNALVK